MPCCSRDSTPARSRYDASTVYAIFTSGKVNLGGGFGTQYCAYHTHGTVTINGVAKTVLYAAMPYNYAYPSACTSGTRGGQRHADPGADYEVNTLAHEIEETTTDMMGTAWYDNRGYENADKCAWTWGTTLHHRRWRHGEHEDRRQGFPRAAELDERRLRRLRTTPLIPMTHDAADCPAGPRRRGPAVAGSGDDEEPAFAHALASRSSRRSRWVASNSATPVVRSRGDDEHRLRPHRGQHQACIVLLRPTADW